MSTTEAPAKIERSEESVAQGIRNCRTVVRQQFADQMWIVGNLPSDQQTAMYALLNHLVRAIDYLDLESSNGLPLDVWAEFRDELNDAFNERFALCELMPLVDACAEYQIPRQFLFDMVDATDGWIRNREFETFEELQVFASKLGGSALVATVPIVGYVKDGYEEIAMQSGQAITLTRILANIVSDFKVNRIFIAREDIEATELSISRVKVRQDHEGLKHLVRLYGSRIEKLMAVGGELIKYLDYDGRRCFTSLMAVHFELLMKMRRDPAIVLERQGVLTGRELFKLRAKHLLGMEGNVPVLPASTHAGH